MSKQAEDVTERAMERWLHPFRGLFTRPSCLNAVALTTGVVLSLNGPTAQSTEPRLFSLVSPWASELAGRTGNLPVLAPSAAEMDPLISPRMDHAPRVMARFYLAGDSLETKMFCICSISPPQVRLPPNAG